MSTDTATHRKVRSGDGTELAVDVWGETGRALVMVDGATSHRAVNPLFGEVGAALVGEFRTHVYDRRGRGDSGDTPPYDTARELEDLAAVIADAGGSAVVCGFSSGAVLTLDAVAAGLPIERAALFEPPFVVDDSRAPVPADYVARLERCVADGRPGDAAEVFMTLGAGMPAELVAGMRRSPFWPAVEAVAHTVSYDGRFMEGTMFGRPLPTDRWSSVAVPLLVMYGERTEPWLIAGATAAAELLPTATLLGVDGEGHSTSADVLVAALRRFAR